MGVEWIKDSAVQGLYKRVRQNGDVWAVKARLKGRGPVTITLGKTSAMELSEARRRAKNALVALGQGLPPNPPSQASVPPQLAPKTVRQGLNEYTAHVRLKPVTLHDRQLMMQRRFSDWLDRPLASITPQECFDRFHKIMADVRQKKELRSCSGPASSPESFPRNDVGRGEAQRAFRYLGSMFNFFSYDEIDGVPLLPKGNPCNILKSKRVRKALKPRERFLARHERKRLVAEIDASRESGYTGLLTTTDADFIQLLLYTGLRRQEALTLRWENIDWEGETFTVRNTKNGRDLTLPLLPSLERMLRSRKTGSERAGFVFPSPNNPSLPMGEGRIFKRICATCGFRFTPHDLRRTIATVAADSGYGIEAISSLLNHAKAGVTANYICHTPERLRRMLAEIEKNI